MTDRNVIINADVLDGLKQLPDGCVQTCITSPPYWGLRDYGTADWQGGDEKCDHTTPRSRGDDIKQDDKQGTSIGSRLNTQKICASCGAIRIDKQLGLEKTPSEYVEKMVAIFREVRRVLRDDGTVWLNLGDSYASQSTCRADDSRGGLAFDGNTPPHKRSNRLIGDLKEKDLCMIPARVALALQADGWYLRSDIIWSKPNPMPESCTDRPTKAHEYLFLLAKSGDPLFWTHPYKKAVSKKPAPDYIYEHKLTGLELKYNPVSKRIFKKFWKRKNLWRGHDYYYDAEAIREKYSDNRPWGKIGDITKTYRGEGNLDKRFQYDDAGRNRRSVWTIATEPYPQAHFATFPQKLVEPCIMAGTSERGACPECGKAWVRVVEKGQLEADQHIKKLSPSAIDINNRDIKDKGWSHEQGFMPNARYESKTIGWQAACDCGKDPVPCLVLDIFAGVCTVAYVALRAKRDFIMIELNPEYVKMGYKRIELLLNQGNLL